MSKTDVKNKKNPKILPPYNVVLINDNFHTYEYVINMMKKVFGYTEEMGKKIGDKLNAEERCIVWTGPKEVAELKQEQIHAYGPDSSIAACKGSMTCSIEPSV
jgi:ATP-dependent Clp protease adaptor protein ClpS